MSRPPAYSIDDINEFVIPDEPIDTPTSANNQQSLSLTSQGALRSLASAGMFSGFMPKVDLSLTFSAFTTSTSTTNKVRERQYTGGDTLDEPVWATLKRDGLQILRRLFIVVWPMQLTKLASTHQLRLVNFAQANGLRLPSSLSRVVDVDEQDAGESATGILNQDLVLETLDWDLWGPLIFLLVFSVCLGMLATDTNGVFSGSFAFVWLFFFIIGLNIQLLGGTISFLSAISAAGYLMFPIVLGEVICLLLLKHKFFRIILMAVLNVWSIYVGLLSLKCLGVLPGRVLLAMYPLALMYCMLLWLVVIT